MFPEIAKKRRVESTPSERLSDIDSEVFMRVTLLHQSANIVSEQHLRMGEQLVWLSTICTVDGREPCGYFGTPHLRLKHYGEHLETVEDLILELGICKRTTARNSMEAWNRFAPFREKLMEKKLFYLAMGEVAWHRLEEILPVVAYTDTPEYQEIWIHKARFNTKEGLRNEIREHRKLTTSEQCFCDEDIAYQIHCKVCNAYHTRTPEQVIELLRKQGHLR